MAVETSGERLEKILPAACLGEKCVFWAGMECESYMDLLETDGPGAAVDLPPFREGSTYALYGQVCIASERPKLVGTKAQLLEKDVSLGKMVALSGRYGDLPLTIESLDGSQSQVTTLASSD